MQINKNYPCNPYNYAVMGNKENLYIVIHYVGATGTALQNAQYYSNSQVGASAHYFVGHSSEDGAVYQSVEDKDRAWHCGANTYVHPYCRNANSIGIEMCCHQDNAGNWYFDDVTVDNAVELTRLLMQKYQIPVENVIRHYDVTGKNCPAPYVEDEAAWQEFKNRLDKGDDDEMATIIEKIADDAGKTQDEVIEILSFLVKYINASEADWQKEGVNALKDMGLINSDHDAREPLGFGTFGLMMQRFKKTI